MERFEDLTILRGRARYADDLATPPGTLHAAFVRSPLAHAEIAGLDPGAALAIPGVRCVITGADIAAETRPLISGVKVAVEHYALAVDRVRYVGEPVAIVVARDRYLAEDALDAIEVDYRALPVAVDLSLATRAEAPTLHPMTDGNVVHERVFRYGDPERAFARATHVVETTVTYPRNACTPIECYCVVAEHHPGEEAFEVTANFQGPYTLHTVMARSLKVAGNRLRLKTPPESGGSYGAKQAIFPYVVALSIAAKRAGRPVKWLEDRLEHLSAATAATSRLTTLRAALDDRGRILALDYDQLEDCGAYPRAPEPATLYRMHGNLTGAYAIESLAVRNRVVVTNRTPTGLMRGFGGPQVYFALERLVDLAAQRLGIDPLEMRRRNLVPARAMPYRTASGALLDSGDYARSVRRAVTEGGLHELRERRASARAQGRRYGIGFAAIVEPSISNMGYITTLLTPEERSRAGPKNGALATATVSFDPSGAVTVSTASVPQGQGHRTVLAQVVADVLGVAPGDVVVSTDHDTLKDPWSIASGNYSSRFAGAVAGAAYRAAMRLRERVAALAAQDLNVAPQAVVLADGLARARDNPDNAVPIARTAAKAHWSPLSVPSASGAGLRETAFWSMRELSEPDAEDRVNSSGTHGFVFDICALEVDPDTGEVHIDEYVTMHDAGRLLNPMLANGQIRGGFAHGLGAALLEELRYAPDGAFLSGTFADYLPPTASEVPDLVILHDASPSPFTPLGAKGLGEGNAMSTPVCIANAVADAIGRDVTTLPLTRSRIAELMAGEEPANPQPAAPLSRAPADGARTITGRGAAVVSASREKLWSVLLDETKLAATVPGCNALERLAEHEYRATLRLGVGPVAGRFRARVGLRDLRALESLRLVGFATGPLGTSRGEGLVTLTGTDEGTRVTYDYAFVVSGKAAAVGARLLEGAARAFARQLVARLKVQAEAPRAPRTLIDRLRALARRRG